MNPPLVVGDTDPVDEAGLTQVRRPSTLAAAAVVAATVAAVVATLSVPHLLSAQGSGGPKVPQPPAPSYSPDAPGTRSWQPVRCPPKGTDTCAAPLTLDHAGLLFSRIDGWRRVVGAEPVTRSLSVIVPASRSDRWVLVGIDGTGPESRIGVQFGNGETETLPDGRLSLFPLTGDRPLQIVVGDIAPRVGEVLRIEEYLGR
jgi:hypothetical protein